jgi:hypothetical protein
MHDGFEKCGYPYPCPPQYPFELEAPCKTPDSVPPFKPDPVIKPAFGPAPNPPGT